VKTNVLPFAACWGCFLVYWLAWPLPVRAQSNLLVRVAAANITSGNSQSYESPGIRIFQGLKPDIVAIQEFRYNGSASDLELRQLVDTAFGATFSFYREPYTGGGDIPNGIISRWPILSAGSWDDLDSPNRGFAWAQIDLPGTNDLYVVSVHLLTSSSTVRANEAAQLKALIQSNFPANAWILVGGDLNTSSRTEPAINTLTTILSDNPVPTDAESGGDSDTNAGRNDPYDYLLPSFSLTNYLTSVALPTHTFPQGLVFDSRVYTPLTDVSPVLSGDSGAVNMQHMAVIKDFFIPVGIVTTNPPMITLQPQSQTNIVGANVTFNVVATGSDPLTYQWRFNTTNIAGANESAYTVANIQLADGGDYSVVITNLGGTITSFNALLTVTTLPLITVQPQSQAVNVGDNATFTVGATGPGVLSYQWRFSGTDLPGAINPSFTRTNAQPADVGNYTAVVTNASGSVTSAVATLTVRLPGSVNVIAQWSFNSVPPDGLTTTGTTTPSIGSGTATLFGGTTASFATGDTTLDPASGTDNSGWNTTTYPTQGTENKTRGVQFNVSTAGKQNIVVTWTSQSSNTGNKYERLQYTTNGTTYFDFPTVTTNITSFTARTNNLSSLAGVHDNPAFAIRILSEFESTATGSGLAGFVAANPANTYATGGTMRYDMVTILGSSIPASNPPAQAPVLTNAALSGNQFQFLLTGTTGSNYIVQAAANLAVSNWISLRTNAAPFMFVETNVFVLPQRFYRGLVAP